MRSLINHYRIARGLRWQRQTPSMAELGFTLKNIAAVALLLALYGIVGSIDYADQQSAAAAAANVRAARINSAMLACLNGGSPGYYTTDANGTRHYIVCETHTVSDKGVKS